MPATMAAWGGAVLTVLVDDVDYSCYVTDCNVTRAKNRIWDPAEAGLCDLRIELGDGGTPADVCNVGDPVTVDITYGSVSRRIFTGRLQYRKVEISPPGDVLSLSCVDEFMFLGRINRRHVEGVDFPVGDGETVNARILRWLTDSGTSSSITVDSTTFTCPATLIDGNTLLQIQATAFADGGDFFVAGDGTLTFKAWAWQVTADTADCLFSDRNAYGAVPYTSAIYAHDLDEMQNYVAGTRRANPTVSGDTPITQISENTTSVGVYGLSGDPADNLELSDDAQVATRVGALVQIAAYPNPRFDSIVVNPALDPPLMWPQIIPLTYSALVMCNRKYLNGGEVSKYGHIIGEYWRLTANTAEVEYRCSGTGTWDGTRPPRPPIALERCPDGSYRIPARYPCNFTCDVVAKAADDTVLHTWAPGSLCSCGNVFPPDGTVEICFDCAGFPLGCTDFIPDTADAILWLDASDEVPERMIEKIDGDNPYIAGLTTGFAGTRLNVIDGTSDAIDATLSGGLVATATSSHVAAASFSASWTIEFWLWLDNNVVTGDVVYIFDVDSIKVRIAGYNAGFDFTSLELEVIQSISGVDTPAHINGLSDIPLHAWHKWRLLWDGTAISVYRDGILQ